MEPIGTRLRGTQLYMVNLLMYGLAHINIPSLMLVLIVVMRLDHQLVRNNLKARFDGLLSKKYRVHEMRETENERSGHIVSGFSFPHRFSQDLVLPR